MRIAFDIDETLIPYGTEFPVENSVPLAFLRLFFRERLRVGSIQLFRTLAAQGHDLWFYTTSGRTSKYLRTWFLLNGIRIGGVVNCDVHARKMRAFPNHYPECEKYPPAFDIDLLIDNSRGVELEGKRHGFDVLCIDPASRDWTEQILTYVTSYR